jgi:hypothetical protein
MGEFPGEGHFMNFPKVEVPFDVPNQGSEKVRRKRIWSREGGKEGKREGKGKGKGKEKACYLIFPCFSLPI